MDLVSEGTSLLLWFGTIKEPCTTSTRWTVRRQLEQHLSWLCVCLRSHRPKGGESKVTSERKTLVVVRTLMNTQIMDRFSVRSGKGRRMAVCGRSVAGFPEVWKDGSRNEAIGFAD